MKRFIGWLLLVAVFAGLFMAIAAAKGGLINAAIICGIAVAVAAVIVGAVWLIV
jgi:uncharacterized membrane protein (DUF485 family)